MLGEAIGELAIGELAASAAPTEFFIDTFYNEPTFAIIGQGGANTETVYNPPGDIIPLTYVETIRIRSSF